MLVTSVKKDKTLQRPSIAVITVTYNASRLIRSTMDSVLGQTRAPDEYIIVDGGSKDGTLEIVRERETKLSYWISEPDGGIYDAMNKAVKASKSEWTLFMNAGDKFVSEETLELAAPSLSEDFGVVYGDCIVVYPNGKTAYDRALSDRLCYYRMIASHQSIFVRRELLERHPFDHRFRIAADFHLLAKLFSSGVGFLKVEFPVGQVVLETYSWEQVRQGLKEKRRAAFEVHGSLSVRFFHIWRYFSIGLKHAIKKLVKSESKAG